MMRDGLRNFYFSLSATLIKSDKRPFSQSLLLQRLFPLISLAIPRPWSVPFSLYLILSFHSGLVWSQKWSHLFQGEGEVLSTKGVGFSCTK